MSPLPTYEPEPLGQLRELDIEQPGLMNELIRIFVGDAPKQLLFIEAGLRENNPERVLSQRMAAVAFEWHNYGKSTIGNKTVTSVP